MHVKPQTTLRKRTFIILVDYTPNYICKCVQVISNGPQLRTMSSQAQS